MERASAEQVVARNVHEARRWLHKAATRGHAEAQLGLGVMLHEAGTEGERNEARSWIERAAQQGLPAAHDKLGMIHETGSNGAPVDYIAAKACYMRAAEQGFAAGQVHLASIFERLGDRATALHWYPRTLTICMLL
jgi:TPR repeat protein